MRIVAKIQLNSVVGDARSQAASEIDKWRDAKFERMEDGSLTIRRSGREALFERRDEEVSDENQTRFSILEPIDGGTLQTDVCIVSSEGRTALLTTLSIGSDGILAPLGVTVRAPKFLRSIVSSSGPWTVGIGGERVFANSMRATIGDIDELQTLIEFPRRRLPVLLVSEFDGRTLGGDLHELLSADLSGLAHVVRLSTEGAWELTKRWGAEWSCYNGATRLLWPMRGGRGDPRAHPLWTMDRLLARNNDVHGAKERLRSLIDSRILETSTYVPDDPAFAGFAKKAARAVADQARADVGGDLSLATAYERQIAAQRAEIDEKDRHIEVLNENVQSLSMALRTSRPQFSTADEDLPVLDTEPQSISEAVAIARRELEGKVAIAAETQPDLEDLNPEAGPPEKVLRYLRALGELSDQLALGALGLSVPKWLESRNVVCSVDSETAKTSAAGRSFRLRKINGEDVDCEFHAKPAEGTSPDRCVRIYFAVSSEQPHVRVGYIGRHTV